MRGDLVRGRQGLTGSRRGVNYLETVDFHFFSSADARTPVYACFFAFGKSKMETRAHRIPRLAVMAERHATLKHFEYRASSSAATRHIKRT